MPVVDLQRLVGAIEDFRELVALGPTSACDLHELTKAEADLAGVSPAVFARLVGVDQRLIEAGYLQPAARGGSRPRGVEATGAEPGRENLPRTNVSERAASLDVAARDR